MGFMQDFTQAFSPAWERGVTLGQQRFLADQQLDMERQRLGLSRDQWQTQKPLYEAEAQLKGYQAQELQQALEMYKKLAPMWNAGNAGYAPAPQAPGFDPGPPQPIVPQTAGPTGTVTPDGSQIRPWKDPAQPVGDMINWVANYHGIDPKLFQRNVQIESGFNQNAVSPKGAMGYGQLMPDTAKGLGVDPTDPYQNLMGSAKYFKQLLDQNDGNVVNALWAYNAGPGNLKKGILPDETRNHIQQVTMVPLSPNFGRGTVPTNQPGGTPPQNGRQDGPPPQQATNGPMLVNPQMLPVLVQMASMPGAGGKMATNMLTAAKQGQDLMGFEMPQTKRQNDATMDVWRAGKTANIDLEKTKQQKMFEWQNDPSQPLAAYQTVYGKPFDHTDPDAWKAMDRMQTTLTKPATQVNLNSNLEGKESADQGALQVEQYKGILTAASSANKSLQDIAVAKALMPANTGTLEPVRVQMGATIQGFGLDPKILGFDKVNTPGKAQAFQAVMSNAIINKAGDMKGNLSDKDVNFLKSGVAGLGQTPESNKLLLAASEVWAKRDVEKASFWQQYWAQNKTYSGVEQRWRDYVNSQPPMLEDILRQGGVTPTPQGQDSQKPNPAQFWR